MKIFEINNIVSRYISTVFTSCTTLRFCFYAYTFVVWGLLIAVFINEGKDFKLSNSLILIYDNWLLVYTGQKEGTRWLLKKEGETIWGQFFVYLWCYTALIILFLAGVFPMRFSYVPETELLKIMSPVITFFAATEFSRKMHESKQNKDGDKEEKSG